MRIRKRSNLKKKNIAITFLFLSPLLGLLTYAGGDFYILYDLNSFTYRIKPPITKYFYSLDEINFTRLEEMVHIFDYRVRKFNAPIGIPVVIDSLFISCFMFIIVLECIIYPSFNKPVNRFF
ncbi:MAG: hypothetical protein ACP6IY_12620 [Promethearchaeia archaeon]